MKSNDPIIDKLSYEWDVAQNAKDYRKLGKILRNLINYLKAIEAGIKLNERQLLSKIEFLQDSLIQMPYAASMQVINDLRHARKSVKTSTGAWGAAFKVQLSATERRSIRRKNKSFTFNDHRQPGAPGDLNGFNHDALLPGDQSGDE